MKKILVVLLLFFCYSVLKAQQSLNDQEKALQALKQSGIVRQEGNTLIYKVQKASDTARVRLMYGNLFNNPKYKIRFDVDGKISNSSKDNQIQTQVPVPKNNNNFVKEPISTNSNANTGNCCMCNIKVFEYKSGGGDKKTAPLFTEYNWTVPEGVTKIKIEAWSAGGDGWNRLYNKRSNGNDSIYVIHGGGGGGGAFLLSFIEVKTGDILRMKIPGGGSRYNLTLQLNDRNTGGLNLESGRNAKVETGSEIFDGKGGKLGLVSGVFLENKFSLKGSDGEAAWLDNYENITDNVTLTSWSGLPRLDKYDKFDRHGGNGGQAPRSTHGGTASLIIWSPYHEVAPRDGGFPGGGGGGGWESGKGAPGLIIVYY